MRTLDPATLLGVWERGLGQTSVERALTLLAAGLPETPVDELAELSIGRRDARLMALRELTFGREVTAVVACPSCSERLELTFPLRDIRVTASEEQPERLSLTAEGFEVHVRLPDSRDLAVAARASDGEAARGTLLRRCLLLAQRDGVAVSSEQLPPGVVEAIARAMEEADPQANVQLVVSCPACLQPGTAGFDIGAFFWTEVNAEAERLLRDVAALARAYSWREADVLALSPRRRQLYLEMASG